MEYESSRSYQGELYTDDNLYKSFNNQEQGKDFFNKPKIKSDLPSASRALYDQQQHLINKKKTLRDARFDLRKMSLKEAHDDFAYEDILEGNVIDDREDEQLLQEEMNLDLFSEEEEKTKMIEKEFHKNMQLVEQELDSLDLKKDLVSFENVVQQEDDDDVGGKHNLNK